MSKMDREIETVGSPFTERVMALVAAGFGVDPADGAAVDKFFETLTSRPLETQRKIADDVETLCLASETDPAFREQLGRGIVAARMYLAKTRRSRIRDQRKFPELRI
jgi:hypothetical protein